MTLAKGLSPSPASIRNAEPILAVLRRVLSPPAFTGDRVLEIAAGSGYHAVTFARALPHLVWQPSDADQAARESIAATAAAAGLANLRPPLALDVCDPWPETTAEAIVCINMIHISPWTATKALFAGAARLKTGIVVTYGPYSIAGDFFAESNVAFDASLKARNPAWGIRDVDDIARLAGENGFRHEETVHMPANNLMLVFRR
jgi:hypothetical protein